MFKLTSISKDEKANIQRFIRHQWKTKSMSNPFLGCNTIKIKMPSNPLTVTQEEYATQWVKWTIMEQRRKIKKCNEP